MAERDRPQRSTPRGRDWDAEQGGSGGPSGQNTAYGKMIAVLAIVLVFGGLAVWIIWYVVSLFSRFFGQIDEMGLGPFP